MPNPCSHSLPNSTFRICNRKYQIRLFAEIVVSQSSTRCNTSLHLVVRFDDDQVRWLPLGWTSTAGVRFYIYSSCLRSTALLTLYSSCLLITDLAYALQLLLTRLQPLICHAFLQVTRSYIWQTTGTRVMTEYSTYDNRSLFISRVMSKNELNTESRSFGQTEINSFGL